MKLKILNKESVFYPLRWYVLFVLAVGALMAYYDYYGKQIFATSTEQQWKSSGPGFHK